MAKRKELDDAGLDCGAARSLSIFVTCRVADRVHDLADPDRPREIVPQPAKAPKHAGRSYTAERANECWALDDWEQQLADGTEVKILDVLDDHSRYAVACPPWSTAPAQPLDALIGAAALLGLPARFWSDNAKAFTATLANALAPLGVAAATPAPTAPTATAKPNGSTRPPRNG